MKFQKIKKKNRVLILLLAMFVILSGITVASLLSANAEAPTAICTVKVSEENVGTNEYSVLAEVTFESEDEFTAGLFAVEADNLTLIGCTVKNCTGGEAPEVSADYGNNRILFTGFSDSSVNDFKSYTSLTLILKFKPAPGDTGAPRKVAVKDISIANIDEVKFNTADAEGTTEVQHIHTVGDGWQTDAGNHWKVCTACQEEVDKAAHTEGDWITDVAATTEAGGHRHKECTVCGYHTAEEDTEKLSGGDEHIPGDINGDGSVNNKDLTRLFQYLSDWDVEVNEAALDINGDGSVNNKDLTRLFQYLSDWDVQIF